jgi:[acyl-carrier-protein] S-malonyltransferase
MTRELTAFVFPGQGSQAVGMGRALCEAYPGARAAFEEADEVLGFGLSALCFDGPEDALRLTKNTQPAILATSIATARALLAECPAQPAYVAGHSLGEYTALVFAGAMTFADALRAVRLRGEFMQDAVPAGRGAMAAILGLSGERVTALCLERADGGIVEAANFNAPDQTVISGEAAAVERVMALAKAAGAKRALPLPVSAPFHSALMRPAQEKMTKVLGALAMTKASPPVVTNVGAEAVWEAERLREALGAQVVAPVRWVESVQKMTELGVTTFLEVGPGNVLQGLCRRIAPGARVLGTADREALLKTARELG